MFDEELCLDTAECGNKSPNTGAVWYIYMQTARGIDRLKVKDSIAIKMSTNKFLFNNCGESTKYHEGSLP